MRIVQRGFYLLTFLLLAYLAVFPRSVEVLSHNYLFLLDQGRDYMAVQNIAVNHHLTLIGSEIGGGYAGITGIFQGPFHYYLLSIPFLLLHGDLYGGIILMWLFGLAAVLQSFLLAKKYLANHLILF